MGSDHDFTECEESLRDRQTVKETKSSPQITLSGPHKKDESSKEVPFPKRERTALGVSAARVLAPKKEVALCYL